MIRLLAGAISLALLIFAGLVMFAGWGMLLVAIGAATGKTPAVIIALLIAGFIVGVFK